MSFKELVEEGPIFLTTKAVRGEPLMRELINIIQRMLQNEIIGFVLRFQKKHFLYFLFLDMTPRF